MVSEFFVNGVLLVNVSKVVLFLMFFNHHSLEKSAMETLLIIKQIFRKQRMKHIANYSGQVPFG
jgi:hypothetical protein